MKATLILLLCLLGSGHASAALGAQASPLVDHSLRVSMQAGGRVLDIDGTRVKATDLSRYFADRKSKGRNREASIRVILSPALSLEDYFEIKGLLQKIGFIDATYYVTSEESGRMVEIDTVGQALAIPQD